MTPEPGPPSAPACLLVGIPRVGHRVVLPYLAKGRIYVTGGISTYQIDLSVEIARSHEGAYVRHRRSGTPCVGGDVVDAGGIDHGGGGRSSPPKTKSLLTLGAYTAEASALFRSGTGARGVQVLVDRVERPELDDVVTGREGVTAALIGKGAIAVHEPAVVVYRHRRSLCPRPGLPPGGHVGVAEGVPDTWT